MGSNSRNGWRNRLVDHLSCLLTLFYGTVLLLSLATLPWSGVVIYADLEVQGDDDAPYPITVRVQHGPLLQSLPWSGSVEEKEYVRCERFGKSWWIDVDTQKPVSDWVIASLDSAYHCYCYKRDQGKRERAEAETIKAMLELAK